MIHIITDYYQLNDKNTNLDLNKGILSCMRNPLIDKIYIVSNCVIPEIVAGSIFMKKVQVLYHKEIPPIEFLFDLANMVNNNYEISIISKLNKVTSLNISNLHTYDFKSNSICLTSKDNDFFVFKGLIKDVFNNDLSLIDSIKENGYTVIQNNI